MNSAIAKLFGRLTAVPASKLTSPVWLASEVQKLFPQEDAVDSDSTLTNRENWDGSSSSSVGDGDHRAKMIAKQSAHKQFLTPEPGGAGGKAVEYRVSPTLVYGVTPLLFKSGQWEHALAMAHHLPPAVGLTVLKKFQASFPRESENAWMSVRDALNRKVRRDKQQLQQQQALKEKTSDASKSKGVGIGATNATEQQGTMPAADDDVRNVSRMQGRSHSPERAVGSGRRKHDDSSSSNVSDADRAADQVIDIYLEAEEGKRVSKEEVCQKGMPTIGGEKDTRTAKDDVSQPPPTVDKMFQFVDELVHSNTEEEVVVMVNQKREAPLFHVRNNAPEETKKVCEEADHGRLEHQQQRVLKYNPEEAREVSIQKNKSIIMEAVERGMNVDPNNKMCYFRQQIVLDVLTGVRQAVDGMMRDDLNWRKSMRIEAQGGPSRHRISLYWLLKVLEAWQHKGIVKPSVEMARDVILHFKEEQVKKQREFRERVQRSLGADVTQLPGEDDGGNTAVALTPAMKSKVRLVSSYWPFDMQVLEYVFSRRAKSSLIDGDREWSMTWEQALAAFPEVVLKCIAKRKPMRTAAQGVGFGYMATKVVSWLGCWREQVFIAPTGALGGGGGHHHDDKKNHSQYASQRRVDHSVASDVMSVIPWEQVTTWFTLEGQEVQFANILSTRTLLAREMRLAMEWTLPKLFTILLNQQQQRAQLEQPRESNDDGGSIIDCDDTIGALRVSIREVEDAIGVIFNTFEAFADFAIKSKNFYLDAKIGVGAFTRGALMYYCEEILEIFFALEGLYSAYNDQVEELMAATTQLVAESSDKVRKDDVALRRYVAGKHALKLVCAITMFYSPLYAENYRNTVVMKHTQKLKVARDTFSDEYMEYLSSSTDRKWVTAYYCPSAGVHRPPYAPITDTGHPFGPLSAVLLEGLCEWESRCTTTRALHDSDFQKRLVATVTHAYCRDWGGVSWPKSSTGTPLEQGPGLPTGGSRLPVKHYNTEEAIATFAASLLVEMGEVMLAQSRWFSSVEVPCFPFFNELTNVQREHPLVGVGELSGQSTKSIGERLWNNLLVVKGVFSPASIKTSVSPLGPIVSELRGLCGETQQKAGEEEDDFKRDIKMVHPIAVVTGRLNAILSNLKVLSSTWEEALSHIVEHLEQGDRLRLAPKSLFGFLLPPGQRLERMAHGESLTSGSSAETSDRARHVPPMPYRQMDRPLAWANEITRVMHHRMRQRGGEGHAHKKLSVSHKEVSVSVRIRLLTMVAIACREGRNLELTSRLLETVLGHISPLPMESDALRTVKSTRDREHHVVLFFLTLAAFSRYTARVTLSSRLSSVLVDRLTSQHHENGGCSPYDAVLRSWKERGVGEKGNNKPAMLVKSDSKPSGDVGSGTDRVDGSGSDNVGDRDMKKQIPEYSEVLADPSLHVRRCVNMFRGAVETVQEWADQNHRVPGTQPQSVLTCLTPIGPHVGIVLSGLLSIGDFVGMMQFYDSLVKLHGQTLEKYLNLETSTARMTLHDAGTLYQQLASARLLIAVVLYMRYINGVVMPHEYDVNGLFGPDGGLRSPGGNDKHLTKKISRGTEPNKSDNVDSHNKGNGKQPDVDITGTTAAERDMKRQLVVVDDGVAEVPSLQPFSFSAADRLNECIRERLASDPKAETFDIGAVITDLFQHSSNPDAIFHYAKNASQWYTAAELDIGEAVLYLSWSNLKTNMSKFSRRKEIGGSAAPPLTFFSALGKAVFSVEFDKSSLVRPTDRYGNVKDQRWMLTAFERAADSRYCAEAFLLGVMGDTPSEIERSIAAAAQPNKKWVDKFRFQSQDKASPDYLYSRHSLQQEMKRDAAEPLADGKLGYEPGAGMDGSWRQRPQGLRRGHRQAPIRGNANGVVGGSSMNSYEDDDLIDDDADHGSSYSATSGGVHGDADAHQRGPQQPKRGLWVGSGGANNKGSRQSSKFSSTSGGGGGGGGAAGGGGGAMPSKQHTHLALETSEQRSNKSASGWSVMGSSAEKKGKRRKSSTLEDADGSEPWQHDSSHFHHQRNQQQQQTKPQNQHIEGAWDV